MDVTDNPVVRALLKEVLHSGQKVVAFLRGTLLTIYCAATRAVLFVYDLTKVPFEWLDHWWGHALDWVIRHAGDCRFDSAENLLFGDHARHAQNMLSAVEGGLHVAAEAEGPGQAASISSSFTQHQQQQQQQQQQQSSSLFESSTRGIISRVAACQEEAASSAKSKITTRRLLPLIGEDKEVAEREEVGGAQDIGAEEEQMVVDEQMIEEEKVEDIEETGKGEQEEVVWAPPVAAASGFSYNVRGFSSEAPASEWGAYRMASRSLSGFFRTAPPAAVRHSVANSTAAAAPAAATAATAPAAVVASGAPSACIERGHERDGEGKENREEEGEGNMGESAGDTTLATPGNGKGEYGSPVPAELRPTGRENDALCSWSQDLIEDVEGDNNKLGAGSFGIVLAVTTKEGLPMAMKIMANSNPSEERDTANEVGILEECSTHPNVVGFYGCLRTPTTLCILMPKARWNLAGMIKDKATVTKKQAALIFRQLVSALEFIHGRGIVHRDIKPGNILSSKRGVLLADFGLAVKANHHLLCGESACGTLPYMAPELVQRLPYGPAVDIWAMGVSVFELLHHVRPFTDRPDVQSQNGGGGSAGGSRGGSGRGSVSNTSGSIVTGCERGSGSIETLGGTDRQRVLQRNILDGEFHINTSLVGGSASDFISQLLSRDPQERATAAQAAEHPWINGSCTLLSSQRRKARLEVATVTAERAVSAVQRLQARMQPSSDIRLEAAKINSDSIQEMTKAAESAVSKVGQVAAKLSEVKVMGEEAKRWEKTAAETVKKAAGKVTNEWDEDEEAQQTAFLKAEEIVTTVEFYAREAETPIAQATAVVDSWERVVVLVRQAAPA